MKQSDTTPARTFTHQKDEMLNAATFTVLLNRVKRPRYVYDLMGGVGNFADLIKEKWPKVPLTVGELDAACAGLIHERVPSADIHIGDCREIALRKDCGVVCDFNLLTLKRLRDGGLFRDIFDGVLGEGKTLWYIFSDSALGKLHLNYPKYGMRTPSVKEYISQYRKTLRKYKRYRIAECFKAHARVLFFLVERKEG